MSILIKKARCLELKLPKPLSADTRESYVLRCMLNGHTLSTWMCRFIGIGHLHSVLPLFEEKQLNFTRVKKKAYCPDYKRVMPYSVNVVSMTPEQREEYWANKKPAKA